MFFAAAYYVISKKAEKQRKILCLVLLNPQFEAIPLIHSKMLFQNDIGNRRNYMSKSKEKKRKEKKRKETKTKLNETNNLIKPCIL